MSESKKARRRRVRQRKAIERYMNLFVYTGMDALRKIDFMDPGIFGHVIRWESDGPKVKGVRIVEVYGADVVDIKA